jgi:ribosomal protein S18 acetylase RimI-like enzyme
MFVSGPERSVPEGEAAAGERRAAVEEACLALGRERAAQVRIAQALVEGHEREIAHALVGAGFTWVGDLAYLRAAPPRASGAPQWPRGIVVRHVESIERGDRDRGLLGAALERSYEETLDCPELCGLREMDDVIDSHRATGEWRAALWRLVLVDGQAEGCMLLNHCAEQRSVELVYLGLSAALRGRGLARMLLAQGLSDAAVLGVGSVTCAVDRRNAPAMRLYRAAGFEEFGGRSAYVRPIGSGRP